MAIKTSRDWTSTNLIAALLENAKPLLAKLGTTPETDAATYLDRAVVAYSADKPRRVDASITLVAGTARYIGPDDMVKYIRSDWFETTAKGWQVEHPGVTPGVAGHWDGAGYYLVFRPAPTTRHINALGATFNFEYGGKHLIASYGSTLNDNGARLVLLRSLAEIVGDMAAQGVAEPVQLHRGMGSTAAKGLPTEVHKYLMEHYRMELRNGY